MKNHTKTTSKKKSAGFTLIELIVTISVAAILMSIAVPSFTNMIDSNRLSTGTNELVSALILARSEALKRSQNVSVCASSDETTCSGSNDFGDGWIVFMDCTADGIVDASADCDGDASTPGVPETIIKAHSGLKDLVVTNNLSGTTDHFFGYSFSGRPAGTTTFDVRDVADTSTTLKKIIVSRSGRIRTE